FFKMNLKICSWDVGIKHLSYCIIEKNDDKYNILQWDCINLYEDENYVCEMLKNDGSGCTSAAKFYGGGKNICGRHKSQIENLESESNIVNESGNCQYILKKTGTECGKRAFNIKNDKYLCNAHLKVSNELDKKIVKIKKVNCRHTNPQELTTKLFNKLDEIDGLLNVDRILIENQPTLKNPLMKSMSTYLFSYFVLRGLIDKVNNSIVSNVIFKSPSNKLKVNEDNTIEVYKQKKDENKYTLTKELAMEYTEKLLKDDQKWLDHLNKYKKKDDMCDCYLQGYYYLTKL